MLRGYGELAEESESLVAALLLPDAPIVAWWPHGAPKNASVTSIGRIAHRRITDSANEADPQRALENIRNTYQAGDTDLAWTRLTNWRIKLAAVLDQAGGTPVTAVTVAGASDSPSTILLAAWLTKALDAPVTIVADPPGTGIRGVELSRASGDIRLFRPGHAVAELTQPGQPAQRISLPRRSLRDCLAEELRRLDPDEVFGETVRSLAISRVDQEGRYRLGNPDVDSFVAERITIDRMEEAFEKAREGQILRPVVEVQSARASA